MTKNYELEQEFQYYAKLMGQNVIILQIVSLLADESFSFMVDGEPKEESKDLEQIEKTEKISPQFNSLLKELLLRVLGPGSDELGLSIADEIQYRRQRRKKRLILLAENTAKMVEERQIVIQPVKDKIIEPICNYASLLDENDVEDNNLRLRWAELLTTAVSGIVIQPNYPILLSQLNILDVKILEIMYLEVARLKLSVDQLDKKGFSVKELQQKFAVTKEVILVSINKLYSLGLCNKTEFSTSRMIFGKALDKIFTKIAVGTGERYGLISLEPMGHDFIRACRLKTNDPI